ncbi:DUF5590 domain-containing protein [Lentilactobacillus sp. SPB1-3]|uniref:DUF5590 domain-containing protein n=1 Tax=Lentilactobacillus terminaliae TaxID=3003483 RepID=A0ACD5DCU5_9LACO|nr:DUF5590 domain-containing protein [Lentilactobacillus sp. SPB1-3]MCZ0977224.1 DUF5590 domain-containing protein [Lentilactobacillus sp. SPB1-3]
MQRQRRMKKSNRRIWIITAIVVVVILFSGFIVFHQAESPIANAKTEAIEIAQNSAKMGKVTGFYSENLGKQTYYTVAGNDNRGKAIYAVIAKKGGKVTVVDQKAGMSANQIKTLIQQRQHPKKINSVAITLIQSKPYWIVSYMNKQNKLCFATLNYKTGTIKQLIQNI